MKIDFLYGYSFVHPSWCVHIVAEEPTPATMREIIFAAMVWLVFAMYLISSSVVILMAGAASGGPEMCAYLLLINGWIAFEFASVQRLH